MEKGKHNQENKNNKLPSISSKPNKDKKENKVQRGKNLSLDYEIVARHKIIENFENFNEYYTQVPGKINKFHNNRNSTIPKMQEESKAQPNNLEYFPEAALSQQNFSKNSNKKQLAQLEDLKIQNNELIQKVSKLENSKQRQILINEKLNQKLIIIHHLKEINSSLKSILLDTAKFYKEDLESLKNKFFESLAPFRQLEKQNSELLNNNEKYKKLAADHTLYIENNRKLSHQLSELEKKFLDYKKKAEDEKNDLLITKHQLEKTVEELKASSHNQNIIEEVKKFSEKAEANFLEQGKINNLISENKRLRDDIKIGVYDSNDFSILFKQLSEDNKKLKTRLIQSLIFK